MSLLLVACGRNPAAPIGNPQNPAMLPGYPGDLDRDDFDGFMPGSIGRLVAEWFMRWVDRGVHDKESVREILHLWCEHNFDNILDKGTCKEAADRALDQQWEDSTTKEWKDRFDRKICNIIEGSANIGVNQVSEYEIRPHTGNLQKHQVGGSLVDATVHESSPSFNGLGFGSDWQEFCVVLN